jgi:3-oxoacyl-[acyl-carrier protein] reductase
MYDLTGKVAIITGGSNGIGKATVHKLASCGVDIAIFDLDIEAAKEVKKVLTEGGTKCEVYKVNTANEEEVATAVESVKQAFGNIHILINNAGITRDASMKKMTSAQWQEVIDVNLTGVYNCTKAVSTHMTENGWGRIINASSVVAHYGNFGQTNYVATKAGVIGMTKVWAREFGRKGITVNAIAPGFINTEMMKTVPQDYLDNLLGKTPLNRLGEVEDIANAYAFLSSNEAAYITGTTLNVDGGLVV